MGDLVENVVAGATPKTSVKEYWDGGDIPWLSSGEVHKKFVYFTDKFITSEGYNNTSTKLVPKNSVLIALAGQGKTRGTVAINKIELCTNQSIASIIPNNNLYYKFLFYYLESKYEYLRALSSSDGGRGGLNLKLIRSIPIKIPLIDEQKAISEFINLIDKKISILKRKYESYEDFKKYLMQQIFAQKLRFDYEDEWSYMAFDDIFKSISPKKFQIKSGEIQENGNFEVIDQGKNKIAGYYNDANKLFQELPVIIYGDHTTFVKYRKNPFIVGADGVKLLSSKIDANLKYLYYALQHFNIKPEGYKRHFSIIRKIKLPIPVLEEQEHISKLFTTIDSEIDFIKIQVEKTNEFKKGLLQQMFVYIYIRIKFLISVRIFLASNTF